MAQDVYFSDSQVQVSAAFVHTEGRNYRVADISSVHFDVVPEDRARRRTATIIQFTLVAIALLGTGLAFGYGPSRGEGWYAIFQCGSLVIFFLSFFVDAIIPIYYAITIEGKFGTADLVRTRDRSYVVKLAAAINRAVSTQRREASGVS